MERRKIDVPITTIYRLSYYCRGLADCGKSFVSSQELARLTGFSDALVRRDLSYFGHFGIPGKGYPVGELREKISQILGINRKWNVALVGLGNLGSALLKYKRFEKQGFKIIALFDNDPMKIGKMRCGIEVQDISQFEKEVKKKEIEIAIVTVPAEPAQETIDRIVAAGIRGILNFAPAKVKVPDCVSLVNIDMSVELEKLSCLTTRKK